MARGVAAWPVAAVHRKSRGRGRYRGYDGHPAGALPQPLALCRRDGGRGESVGKKLYLKRFTCNAAITALCCAARWKRACGWLALGHALRGWFAGECPAWAAVGDDICTLQWRIGKQGQTKTMSSSLAMKRKISAK